MKRVVYEKKGITLIALVVTIVVLLLLSGVALSATFGENGLISRTRKAEFETKKKEMETELKLLREEKYIDKKVLGQEYTLEEFVVDINEDDAKGNRLKNSYNAKVENGIIKIVSGQYKFLMSVSGEDIDEEDLISKKTVIRLRPLNSHWFKSGLLLSYAGSNKSEQEIAQILNSIEFEGVNKNEIRVLKVPSEDYWVGNATKVKNAIKGIKAISEANPQVEYFVFQNKKEALILTRKNEEKLLNFEHIGLTNGISLEYADIGGGSAPVACTLVDWGNIFKEIDNEHPGNTATINVETIEVKIPSMKKDRRKNVKISFGKSEIPARIFEDLKTIKKLEIFGKFNGTALEGLQPSLEEIVFVPRTIIIGLPKGMLKDTQVQPKVKMFEKVLLRKDRPSPEELFGRNVEISFSDMYYLSVYKY